MDGGSYIELDSQNIDSQHICCAVSDKKCARGYQAKKDWLSYNFEQGYTFRKLDVWGKVFIEYVPAEYAWAPVHAPGYMMIHCFWVSGKYKKQGYGSRLLELCMEDADGMQGLVAVVGKTKKPFLSDKKFLLKQGFEVCDFAPPYFELVYKAFSNDAPVPQFRDIARNAECDQKSGLSIYYSDACPFNDYYVNVELVRIAQEKKIPLHIEKIDSLEKAQHHFVPHTLYSLFYEGKFMTHHIVNEKAFSKYVSV